MVKITVDEWAEKSRRGEVCGILGCKNKPVVKCSHCGNHYCQDHAFVLDTPGHQERRKQMSLEPERAVMGRLFYDKVIEQAKQNREKWGEQDIAKLIQVCQVQLGQIADQYLKNGYSDKFKVELVHLGAVLYELYTQGK